MSGWRWTLNWGIVRDDLLVGSWPRQGIDPERIREAGVSTVLSLQTQACRDAFAIDYDAHRRHAERIGLVLSECADAGLRPTRRALLLGPYALASG